MFLRCEYDVMAVRWRRALSGTAALPARLLCRCQCVSLHHNHNRNGANNVVCLCLLLQQQSFAIQKSAGAAQGSKDEERASVQ